MNALARYQQPHFLAVTLAVAATAFCLGRARSQAPSRVHASAPLRLMHPDGVRDMAFSPDGKLLASAGDNRKVMLWDAQSGQLVREFGLFRRNATRVVFSPDGMLIAATSLDGSARVWEVNTAQLVAQASSPKGEPSHLAFAPDSKSVAFATQEGTMFLIRLSSTSTEAPAS